MFPQFTPNINIEDPRLAIFAEEMRKQLLKPPQGVDATALEFEAKMGSIELNETFK